MKSLSAKTSPQEVIVIYSFLAGQGLVFVTVLYLLVAALINLVTPWSPTLPSSYWSVFSIGYVLTIFGVSFWLHRMATHQSFKAPIWFRYVIGALGAMAVQGYARNWVDDHRTHHAHADKPGLDPHTPRDGFWHAFAGWLVKPGKRPEPKAWAEAESLVAQLEQQLVEQDDPKQRERLRAKLADNRDRVVNREVARYFDRTLWVWVVLSLALPGAACYLLEGTWQAFVIGTVICGFGRIAAVNVATSLVNSYEHKPDFPGNYRHAKGKDDSSNNWFIALFNPEGFHSNHHLFSWAANHGILWWERMLDHTANLLWLFEKVGLVWDVRWVTRAELEQMKRRLAAAS